MPRLRNPLHLDPRGTAAEVLQRQVQAPLAPGPRQAATAPRPAGRDPRRRASAHRDDRSRPAPASGGAGDGLAAEPACPHCRKPVALVAWLVPPAAASVKTPPRHADTFRDNP